MRHRILLPLTSEDILQGKGSLTLSSAAGHSECDLLRSSGTVRSSSWRTSFIEKLGDPTAGVPTDLTHRRRRERVQQRLVRRVSRILPLAAARASRWLRDRCHPCRATAPGLRTSTQGSRRRQAHARSRLVRPPGLCCSARLNYIVKRSVIAHAHSVT